MKRSILIGLSVMLGAAAWLRGAPPSGPGRPNIVFILADDMGYADAGFMGSRDIPTPALDTLARAGTVFTSFYAQTVCSPSRAALMTGRYPSRTGIYTVVSPGEGRVLKSEERTLGQALREAGYETALVGKWHLGDDLPEHMPTRRGFDHQYGLMRGEINYFTHRYGEHLDWYRDDKPCADEGYSTHLLAAEACRRIRDKRADRPLFLYLAFNAVHYPWHVPAEYVRPLTQLKGLRRTYGAMVAAMDEAVGQVAAALKDKGLLDNTLIVFASDNGGVLPGYITSNGLLRGRKGLLYEGGVRVCSFACWPGHIPAGKKLDQPFHMVDWYPTLIRRAGGCLEQTLPLDGRDVWPALTQGALAPHEEILLCGMKPQTRALRSGPWKLLQDGSKVELYNLEEDLGETRDLAAAQSDKARQLTARLEELMKDAATPVPATRPARK